MTSRSQGTGTESLSNVGSALIISVSTSDISVLENRLPDKHNHSHNYKFIFEFIQYIQRYSHLQLATTEQSQFIKEVYDFIGQNSRGSNDQIITLIIFHLHLKAAITERQRVRKIVCNGVDISTHISSAPSSVYQECGQCLYVPQSGKNPSYGEILTFSDIYRERVLKITDVPELKCASLWHAS